MTMQTNNIIVRYAKRGDNDRLIFTQIEVCDQYVVVENGYFGAKAEEYYDQEAIGVGGRKGLFGVKHNIEKIKEKIKEIQGIFGKLPVFVEGYTPDFFCSDINFYDASERDSFYSEQRKIRKQNKEKNK